MTPDDKPRARPRPEYRATNPACCHDCTHSAYGYSEYSDVSELYCMIGVRLPTKKKTCARQSKPLLAIKEPHD